MVGKPKYRKVLLLVLDSVGIGAAPDAADYGDERANTLANMAEAVGGLKLPNFRELGLGNIAPIRGVGRAQRPAAHFGKMREASKGKDTTTGHWELCGIVLEQPFRPFPNGFPQEIIDEFQHRTGHEVIGNCAASGTEIIKRLGPVHERTGKLIVYTSADSVFQIAAHEEVVPLDELYRVCRIARKIVDPYGVARVIARPFVGHGGNYTRTYNRRDFSMEPPGETVLDLVSRAHMDVVGIGKIEDIFAGRGISRTIHTEGNTDGIHKTLEVLREVERGLVFVNLVDFDMLYGHRRNPHGYAQALEEVDELLLPGLMELVSDETLFMITADHGCDPTADWSTDHTREEVPLLVLTLESVTSGGRSLGVTSSFADVGQTIAFSLGVGSLQRGVALPV